MYKLFSQRKREALGQVPDVFAYDTFPTSFRNQFFHILRDVILESDGYSYYYGDAWRFLCSEFAREKGLKYISGNGRSNDAYALDYYVDNCDDESFLDLLDYTFTVIVWPLVDNDTYVKQRAISAITELNDRFMQHYLGYEFINGHLIEKTNEHIHKEVVKPALYLLHDKKFAGAEQEFFQAFDRFRKKQYKDAITNANKAFESVMKVICKERSFSYQENDTAKTLLQHLIDNAFFPDYMESHLNGVRSTLESGVPTVRNRISSHGQGQAISNVSKETVEYALNLVATNIVFLINLL